MIINLPFPHASLSGHGNGSWRAKAKVIKSHRDTAHTLTKAACRGLNLPDGDIHCTVVFTPPDNRSDRLNFPNRMKPYFDGIAQAIGVNDSRFAIPFYKVKPADKKRAGVSVCIITEQKQSGATLHVQAPSKGVSDE